MPSMKRRLLPWLLSLFGPLAFLATNAAKAVIQMIYNQAKDQDTA